MILVTDPGTYDAVYPPLLHADWNGPTATDMIFPCFLVVMGVSVVFSISGRRRAGAPQPRLVRDVARRASALICLGLLLNALPNFNLAHLRIPGVLQRIGVCYALTAGLYLWLGNRYSTRLQRQLVTAGVVLLCLALYWVLLRWCPVPGFRAGALDPQGTLPAVIDRAVFGVAHLWPYGTGFGGQVVYDPEGILSTLPAFSTTLFGLMAGEELMHGTDRREQCAVLVIGSTVLILAGLGLSGWMPLNKKIWTSTFALLSAGISLLLLAAAVYLMDVKGWRKASVPFQILGTNAIFAYVLSQIVTSVLDHVHLVIRGQRVSLHALAYATLFATWLPPRPASLAYAISIVLLILTAVQVLYRRKIFLAL